MSARAIAALGLSLALLLGGCAQVAGPEAAPEPANVETQDSGSSEITTEAEQSADADAPATGAEEADPDANEEGSPAADGDTQSQTASPSATASATASPTPTTAPETPTPSEPPASPSPTESPTETSAPTPEPDPGFTLAEVATRNTASNCWAAISGNVYDLTDWITRHPGGAGAITQLCGRDATSQFQGRHGGQSTPMSTLAGYLIGPLR